MLPYSLGGALASIPVALFNDYLTKKTKDTSCYKYVIIAGLAIATLGFGGYLFIYTQDNYSFFRYFRVADIVK